MVVVPLVEDLVVAAAEMLAVVPQPQRVFQLEAVETVVVIL